MANQTLYPGVNYRLGPTRQLPVSGQYLEQLMEAVKRTDPALTIDITSAGQVPEGTPGPRTGSNRHDVDHTGHSHTSDLVLVRDGKPIRPGDDEALYARFLQNAAAAGFTGLGHYDWGVHVGGGSKAMWGPTTGSGSINPTFAQAINAGWSGQWAGAPLPTGPEVPQAPQTMDPTATPMNPSGTSFSFAQVADAGAGYTTVFGSDGLKYTFEGPRNWRNNNPGNIEFGDFAKTHGAIGTDGRFAIFPTYQAGRDAKRSLLFEGEGYAGLTINSAMHRYAPPSDGNPTSRYVATLASTLGISADTPLAQLTPEQQNTMLDAMEQFEGYKAGRVMRDGQLVNIDLKSTFNPRNGPASAPFAGDSTFSMAANNHSVDIGQTNPSTPFTNQELAVQEAERQAAAEANKASLLDLAGTAIREETVLGWALRDKPQFMPDPTYEFDAKTATEGVPQQYWDRFEHTTSQAETDFIRKGIIESMQADQKLADAGWTGVALRIGAGMTDPVAWAAGVGIGALTGGTGLAAVIGAKFGRAGMIATGALTGATATAIPEAYIASQKPTYQASDLAIAVGTGLVLGGAFGAFTKNAGEARQIEQLGKSMLRGEGDLVSPRQSNAGAAQASVREDLREDAVDLVRDLDETVAPNAFGGKLRWDLSARLKQSENKYVRALGNVLVEDGTRNKSGVTPFSASEEATKLARVADVKWRRSFDTNFKAWAKRTGVKHRDMRAARTQFSKDITAYVRNRNPMEEVASEVSSAAGEFRNLMRHWRELAAKPGMLDGTTRRAVRGFDQFENNAFYAPRIFDLGAVQSALARYGHDTLATFVGRAMREVNEDLTEEAAFKFGKGYIKRLHSLSAGELNLNARALSGEDMEGLKALLRDGSDLSDAELDDILLGIKKPASDRPGASPRAKKRLFMDEAFEARLARMDGTGDEGGDLFKISDLFMNDSDELMNMYSRQMAGRIAMARVRIENPRWNEGDEGSRYLVDGITSDSEWELELQRVRSVGDSTGALQHSAEDIERLQFAYNNIVGRPHWNENSSYAHTLRMLRDYNFMRVMGQVGFAQVAELGNVMWQTGLRATFTNVPSFRALWRNAKTGKLDDTLAQEWEDITGIGADWLRHSDMRRLDDFDNPLGGIKNNPLLEKIDSAQQRGIRAMTAISGMAPINTALQRLTGRAIFNKFAQLAQSGRPLGEAQMRRMRGLGLTDEMLDRIRKEIKTSASFDGSRLKAMNFAQWGDQEALAAFENAVFRMARTVVQENDIGNVAMWMSKPTAKTLLQFRSFMLASWSKQFLNGMNHMDFTMFASFATTAFLGTITYAMQTHLNAIGRADREEFLNDRLSPTKLASAGIQRSSWFGIFAPGIDTVVPRALGTGPLFDARTTQQSSDAFLGNPTVGLIDGALSALSAPREIATGEFDRADAQRIRTLFVFQNAMGITQLFNATAGQLPE